MITITTNDNLNEFKGYCNGFKDDVALCCKALNNASNGCFYLEDIITVYRNKIFSYNEKVVELGDDLFSPNYYSRYIMKIYFDILLINGINDLTWLMNNINKVGYLSKYVPILSKATFGKVAQRYNNVCNTIKEFEFKDNVDVIYNFFSNKLLFEGFVPGAIIRFWRDVKKELQVLGFELTIEELDKINDEVLNREFEAVDRYMNLGEDAFIEFDKKCIELGLYLKTNEYVVRDDNVQLKKQ